MCGIYDPLFEPVKIGTMTVKNRMIVPSMVTNYCSHDGTATERYLAYHRTKAEGGWGLIITEAYKVTETCGGYYNMAGLWSDDQIESHKKLTDTVHEAGGKIVCQLIHGGRQVTSEQSGVRGLAPSAVKDPTADEVPKEMSLRDIEDIENSFVNAAVRAKKAGFDGVEIHAAHGYLINEFLSAFSNKRSDNYGGTVKNRARFMIEIIEKTRAAAGPDYPLILRLTTNEYVEGGIDLYESRIFARMAERAGVNAIHATQGVYKSAQYIIPPCAVPSGRFQDNAAAMKSAVNIPVIAVGRINTPETALDLIESGKADLVAMGRASIADPDLPNKLKEGREEDICRCIGCVQGCIGGINRGESVACMVNPRTGRENTYPWVKADRPKKVVVAGAGVAGMEAALAASKRGHEVVIYEQKDRAGGQWLSAAVPPGKAEFNSFVVWQKEQLRKAGVPIHLSAECSAEMIREEHADAVIIATGGRTAIPPIPGLGEREYATVTEILSGEKEAKGSVVVIGGGLAGAETAEHLSCHGLKVSLVEMLPEIARDGEPTANGFMMENLANNHVDIYTSATVMRVQPDCAEIKLTDGSIKSLPADTLIIATGTRACQPFGEEYESLAEEVYLVGDAAGAKNGLRNIAQGFETGYQI